MPYTPMPLGQIISLEYGKPLPQEDRTPDGVPAYGANGILCFCRKPYRTEPSLIIGRKGSAGEVTLTEGPFWPTDVTYYVEHDRDQTDLRFLYHLLKFQNLPRLAKGVKPGINRNDVYALTVPVPPLSEQKRIVAILDEAFEGIGKAVANTEKNLDNINTLFERLVSESVFGPCEDPGWSLSTVSEVAAANKGSIRTGPFGSQLLHSEFVDQGVAVLGIDNAAQNEFAWSKRRYISAEKYASLIRYTVKPGDVLITIMGTCGRCAVVPDDIPTAINTKHLCCITLDRRKCLPEYLHAYFLYHPLAREYLGRHAKGAIMAGLNMSLIQEMPLALPSLKKQAEIAERVSSAQSTFRSIEANYGHKLSAMNELKQSMLANAFAGQLLAKVHVATVAPVRNQQSATEVTAAILAFAYERHAAQRREKTLGHVKAQKTLHLVEAIAGVELGRYPIKDAAGPNDFGHMLRAEEWAKSRGLFEFANRPNGYDFKPLANYKSEIGVLVSSLSEHQQAIERVIDLLIPMNSEQAEVLATVHAAWNNLLADGKIADDSAILYEARENWHPSKLKIAESKFRDAIKFIRAKGIVPDGSAKPVRGQDRLL